MAGQVKKKRGKQINFLSAVHTIQNFITFLMQFVKVVIIVSVFIIGRLDFYVRENLEFDYEDIALSFGSYKDTYLINRIVELNFTEIPDEEPLPELEITTQAETLDKPANSNASNSGDRFAYNVTIPLDIYVDDTPLIEKLRYNYSVYVAYFWLDLLNNLVIFYTLERRHFKTLFLFQMFDVLWILVCYWINFYCCLIESLLFKCFVILLIALFVLIDFLS